jgi:hypothetical protein
LYALPEEEQQNLFTNVLKSTFNYSNHKYIPTLDKIKTWFDFSSSGKAQINNVEHAVDKIADLMNGEIHSFRIENIPADIKSALVDCNAFDYVAKYTHRVIFCPHILEYTTKDGVRLSDTPYKTDDLAGMCLGSTWLDYSFFPGESTVYINYGSKLMLAWPDLRPYLFGEIIVHESAHKEVAYLRQENKIADFYNCTLLNERYATLKEVEYLRTWASHVPKPKHSQNRNIIRSIFFLEGTACLKHYIRQSLKKIYAWNKKLGLPRRDERLLPF